MTTTVRHRTMEERSETALVALRRILRATELNSKLLANQTGLTTSQFILLQKVVREGKVSPSALARSARLTQATVTSLVDKLERARLVTRRRDTEDRRRIWIEPTAAGRQAVAESPDLLHDRFRARFLKLEDWEQAMIITALERVSMLLDAGAIDASPVLDIGDLDRLLNSS
ncbi:MAG TPA: MarR family winged helix-turn-helix transcriptional regulator [Woeseiaceae bacterium]|nr:MarR family winged helix-turn-helix transcriptional regulator [Woeseiaceae bacterium]